MFDVEEIPKDYDPETDNSIVDFNCWWREEDISAQAIIEAFQFTDDEVLCLYRVPYLGPDSIAFNFIFIVKDYKAQINHWRANM